MKRYLLFVLPLVVTATNARSSIKINKGKVNHFSTIVQKNSGATLDKVVKEYKNVIVKYGANWCGPCKALKTTFENIAKEYPNVVVISVDVDKNGWPTWCQSIPAVQFYKNGKKENSPTKNQGRKFYKNLANKLYAETK